MHVNFLSKYYFINNCDTNNLSKLDKDTTIIFRNYSSKYNLNTILDLKRFCKINGYKFFLSNNVKLALNLKLDGAYIPSFNRSTKHLSFSLTKKFLLIGSAHNNKEIKVKEKQMVKIIFLSSIFKKNKNYLGLNKFKLLSKLTNNKVIALGGISNKNLKKLKLVKCLGFAGISFFE
jgi:thiamine-phosphate pyrophosphorylase